jgi:heme oxygenase (mycobilin-producing)
MSVILINCFEVPPGREDDFLTAWHAIADHLAKHPGYVATKLHRSVRPDARFAFVNVGEWATPQDFQSATTSDEFRRLADDLHDFPASPGLYTVEYEHVG